MREEAAVFSIWEMAPSGGWMNEWRMQMLHRVTVHEVISQHFLNTDQLQM